MLMQKIMGKGRKTRRRPSKSNQSQYSTLEERRLLAAGADLFPVVNRTSLYVGQHTTDPGVKIQSSVLDNDHLSAHQRYVLTASNTTALGGEVNVYPDGTFEYHPPETDQYQGNTDFFWYMAGDGSVGHVHLQFQTGDRIAYVNPHAASGGNGTSAYPYNDVTDLYLDYGIYDYDTIYFFGGGDVEAYGGDLPVVDYVTYAGSGSDFYFGGFKIADAYSTTVISDYSGYGFELGDHTRIQGLGIDGYVFNQGYESTLTIRDSYFENTVDYANGHILLEGFQNNFYGYVITNSDPHAEYSSINMNMYQGGVTEFIGGVSTNELIINGGYAEFSGHLQILPTTNRWAVDMSYGEGAEFSSFGGLDIAANEYASPSSLQINGIRAGAEDQVYIYSDRHSGIRADINTNGNHYGGRIIWANGAYLDVQLTSVYSANSIKPPIEVVDSEGNFAITGHGNHHRGGDSSGGIIRDSDTTAVFFKNFDGNINLTNLELTNNLGHAVNAEDVQQVGLWNSRVDGNGGIRRWTNSVRVENAYTVDVVGNEITNTLSYTDVNILNDRVDTSVINVNGNLMGGRGFETGYSLSISGFGFNDAFVTVHGNEFIENNHDHVFIRTRHHAVMQAEVSDNYFSGFDGNGLSMRQVGQSSLEFSASNNTFDGKTDLSSKFSIYMISQATYQGGGWMWSDISHNDINYSRGILYNLRGYDTYGSSGYMTVANNDLSHVSAFAGVSAVTDNGRGNQLDVHFHNNMLNSPYHPHGVGFRVVAGLNGSPVSHQQGTINAQIHDNSSTSGYSNAGYYIVERNHKRSESDDTSFKSENWNEFQLLRRWHFAR